MPLIIEVYGWKNGIRTNSVIQLIRVRAGLDLKEAKKRIEFLMDGTPFWIELEEHV